MTTAGTTEAGGDTTKRIAELEATMATLERGYLELAEVVKGLERRPAGAEDRISICCFSGEFDRLLAAFIIANGAAAMGTEVNLFFTFWGTAALRNPQATGLKKPLMAKMFGWMLPKGHKKLKLSKMNMAGAGPLLIKRIMRKQNVASMEELIETAAELGVRISICCMSMDLLGMPKEEFISYPDLRYCGVAQFLEDSEKGHTTLFI